MAIEDLSPKQHRAIMLLASGATNDQVAVAVGVKIVTVRVWLRNEFFRTEVRRAMERVRQIFESRMMNLASNAAVVVDKMISDKDPDRQSEGAKLALNAAVRLSGRYKELQVEGYVPPPMFVLPEGSRISTVRVLPVPPPKTSPQVEGQVIEVDATHMISGASKDFEDEEDEG